MAQFPIAPKHPYELTQHGQTRIDNYYWLRDKENPETLKHIRAESDYLEEVLGHTRPLQEKLFAEMKARIKEDDSTVPAKRGEYYYYRRYEAGKQYPIICRKHGSLDSAEEVLLDQNELAAGKSYCSIGDFSVSPDGQKLAYSVDYEGQEAYTLYIKDLTTGQLFPESIENVSGSAYEEGGVEWASDSETLFYVLLGEALRPFKLFRHKLNTNPADDQLVFHEEDETFSLYVFKTRDDSMIMTYHYNTDMREVRFLPADQPQQSLKILQPRTKGLEYFAAHHKGTFYILNNADAPNYKLSVAPVENPLKENWRDVIPHREDVMLEGLDTFVNHLVLAERTGGLVQLRVSRIDQLDEPNYIQFPEPAYYVEIGDNPEFNTNLLRLKYSSLVTPESVIDYHMDTGGWETKKEDEIPGGYDKTQYISERIHAAAPDGTRIPISIVYKKGLKKDGSNPTLLHGYGAYGAVVDAAFNSNRISLLDRGFVFAIGHIRGGSDMGRAWYEAGRLRYKKNSFTDFIACAEELINEGFTSNEKLSILGVSAGGLLVGASMTMRPDLFKAVICKVPFVDVITSMGDPSIPLTTLEYDQWGNPENEEDYNYMLSYSPYDNIRATEYPHVLITTGLNDPRVAYWEPVKFAAKLRELKTDDHVIALYTNYNSGHAGASGRYDYLREVALDYAFLIDRLGARNIPN